MKEIILATMNEGKRRELQSLLAGKVKVLSLRDYPNCPDIEETGTTFTENARIKAEFVAEYTGLPALADDSGLVVDALDGAPGVYSARFAGEEKDDEKNNKKLLENLKNVPEEEKTARFVCALVYVYAEEQSIEVTGTCEGKIAEAPTGQHGFGYDPLFYIPSRRKTLAEMTADEKNTISHRGAALQKMLATWRERNIIQ